MTTNNGVRVAIGLLALLVVFWLVGWLANVLWTIFVLALIGFLIWFIWRRR